MKARLDTQTETQIVAMIARGDTYDAIRRVFEAKGDSIAISTISDVKRRNMESLKYMQGMMVEQTANQSTKILAKSRELIDRKLNRALKQEEDMEDLKEQYKDGDMEDGVFRALFDKALKSELSVQELTSLSREMFTQSQVEQGKPTTISDNPTQAKENLRTLLEAINAKDERQILEALFVKS